MEVADAECKTLVEREAEAAVPVADETWLPPKCAVDEAITEIWLVVDHTAVEVLLAIDEASYEADIIIDEANSAFDEDEAVTDETRDNAEDAAPAVEDMRGEIAKEAVLTMEEWSDRNAG